MKKVLNILSVVILVVYLFVALGFSSEQASETLCTGLNVILSDSAYSGFYTGDDISAIVLSPDSKVVGFPMKVVNTRIIEEKLNNKPYIKNAEVFSDVEGVISVFVEQRKPMVRIMTQKGNNYYLDKEGYLLPARGKFVPYVLIANGYFTDEPALEDVVNIHDLDTDRKYKEWQEALSISNFIHESKFWRAQVVQLYCNRKGDFELIPRVGAHQIMFGSADDLKEKFGKLETLYREGLPYEGWNNYNKINLKYKNQVICTKR